MARSIDAGRAVLRLTLDDKELNKKFAETKRSLRNLGRSVTSAGLQIGTIGAAITAPFALATKQFLKTGDELNKMAARTGVAVEALSELKFAAEQSGAGLGDVEKGIKRMQQTLLDAELGLSTATDALELLGLELAELKGKRPEEQFELIAAKLADIEDPSRRAAVGLKVFGRAGAVLLPMVADMAALRQEARDLGVTIDTETAQSAADLADSFNRVSKTVVGLAVQVGASLAPVLIDLATFLQSVVVYMIDFIKANRNLVVIVAGTGAALTAMGTALVVAGGAITLMSTAVGGLTTAIAVLRVGLTLLSAHPIVAALLLVGGIVAWLTDGFGLFSSAVDESAESLDKVVGAKLPAGGNQRAELEKQAAATQRQIQAQLTAVQPSAAAAAKASDTEKNMLRELVKQTRVAIDTLEAINSGGFVAGGA